MICDSKYYSISLFRFIFKIMFSFESTMAEITSCDEQVLELSPDAALLDEIDSVDLVDQPIDESILENWMDDLSDSGLANFSVQLVKHRNRPDCDCVVCVYDSNLDDAESQVEPQTPITTDSPQQSHHQENPQPEIVASTPERARSPVLPPRNDIVVQISNPPNRTRVRTRNTIRQRRRSTFVQARAEAQTWRQGHYLWDPTAREYQAPYDIFPPGDRRNPREFTVVCAFGHDILVPRYDRMRYRKWRRYLPCGRLLISWDQSLRLASARLTPTLGVPY